MKRAILLTAICLAILAGYISINSTSRSDSSIVLMLDQSILLAY